MVTNSSYMQRRTTNASNHKEAFQIFSALNEAEQECITEQVKDLRDASSRLYIEQAMFMLSRA